MKKIIVFGDLHFKKNILIPDTIEGVPYYRCFFSQVCDIIKEENPNYVVFLGDIYDRVSKIHPEVFSAVFDFFVALDYYVHHINPYTEILVVTGNHDMYDNSNKLLAYLNLLNHVRLDHSLSVPVEEGGSTLLNLHSLPYYNKDLYRNVNDLPYGEGHNVYFSHLPLSDFERIGYLSIDSILHNPNVTYFVSGHYHFVDLREDKYLCIGTPYGINFSDSDKEDYYYLSLTFEGNASSYEMRKIRVPFRFRTVQGKEHMIEPYTMYRLQKVLGENVVISPPKLEDRKLLKYKFVDLLDQFVKNNDTVKQIIKDLL